MRIWKEEIGATVTFIVLVIAFSIVILGLQGCHDGCDPEATRCAGTRVEICNTETDWELEADCADIEDFGLGIEWTCCLDPEDGLHSCLPSDECDGDSDAGDGGS